MNRVLVVCYSRGGATRRVAKQLAESLGADLDEITESESRAGLWGYVRSALEAVCKGIPAVETRTDPRDYDQVIIGTPVWAGVMSSPVRSYLLLNHRRLPSVAFFAVMGGQGAEAVLREMQVACGVEDAPTFFTTQRQVEKDGAIDAVREFAKRLGQASVGAPSRRVAAA
jgi:flavodoxin